MLKSNICATLWLCWGSGSARFVPELWGIAATISLDWFVLHRVRNVVQEIGTQQTWQPAKGMAEGWEGRADNPSFKWQTMHMHWHRVTGSTGICILWRLWMQLLRLPPTTSPPPPLSYFHHYCAPLWLKLSWKSEEKKLNKLYETQLKPVPNNERHLMPLHSSCRASL